MARDAAFTVSVSVCSPGVMKRTRTPRARASIRCFWVSSSGTKYATDRSMLRSAAVMARWYMSCMLSLPLDGELENICAFCAPAGAMGGKYSAPCSTLPVTLSQLSRKVACICATTGPRTR